MNHRPPHPLQRAVISWLNECNKSAHATRTALSNPETPRLEQKRLLAELTLAQSRINLLMTTKLSFTGVSRPVVLDIPEE